ncbi:MAG: aminoacyl-tRNA hydrolase [Actinobacteria bacterium TMED172]|nr:MAG: aminoacyl-tRNA hydrolase [Actinobacteria bacterium TMED172]
MSVFRRAAQRRGTPADYLVVGLGNPGDKYLGSRHNLGYEVIEKLAEMQRAKLELSRPAKARVAAVDLFGLRCILACPTTYMNLSGEAVSPLIRNNGVTDISRVIVVHDELDLEPGRVKIKRGGSSAGHNGLKSISQHLKNDEFIRIRVGVGKPPHPDQGKNWVLRRPSPDDRSMLDRGVETGVEAARLVIEDGVDLAMNEINGRQL